MPLNLDTARGEPMSFWPLFSPEWYMLWTACLSILFQFSLLCILSSLKFPSFPTKHIFPKHQLSSWTGSSWILSIAKFLLYSHWLLLAEIHWWSHEVWVILTRQVYGTDVRRRMSPLIHEWSRVWWHPKDPVCPNCYSRGYVGSYPGSLAEEILSQNTLEQGTVS